MNVPVVLFMFKRRDTLLKIIDKVRIVEPSKVYLISDQGRNAEEKKQVEEVRRAVEKAIDWKCELIKDYADENRGVYKNIGMGALRVFQRENKAIFLEDDNYPDLSFFKYCENMLDLYEKDEEVLWVCGTNYYEDINKHCNQKDNYYFTQHLLPCGWASWSAKFQKYYDKDLLALGNEKAMHCFKKSYEKRSLYKQQLRDIKEEQFRWIYNKRYNSWDYHMLLSIRANDLFGIVPAKNLITNIGDDSNSIHGGDSMQKVMTSRFCHVGASAFVFPIVKRNIEKNRIIENLLSKKILYPIPLRIRVSANRFIKKMLGIRFDRSLKDVLRIHRSEK